MYDKPCLHKQQNWTRNACSDWRTYFTPKCPGSLKKWFTIPSEITHRYLMLASTVESGFKRYTHSLLAYTTCLQWACTISSTHLG